MEHFEELVTAHIGVANPVLAGVDNLEKGAFERGLPDSGETFSDSASHQAQVDFDHRARQRVSPRAHLRGDGHLPDQLVSQFHDPGTHGLDPGHGRQLCGGPVLR